jgi:hypothetical protein
MFAAILHASSFVSNFADRRTDPRTDRAVDGGNGFRPAKRGVVKG